MAIWSFWTYTCTVWLYMCSTLYSVLYPAHVQCTCTAQCTLCMYITHVYCTVYMCSTLYSTCTVYIVYSVQYTLCRKDDLQPPAAPLRSAAAPCLRHGVRSSLKARITGTLGGLKLRIKMIVTFTDQSFISELVPSVGPSSRIPLGV